MNGCGWAPTWVGSNLAICKGLVWKIRMGDLYERFVWEIYMGDLGERFLIGDMYGRFV